MMVCGCVECVLVYVGVWYDGACVCVCVCVSEAIRGGGAVVCV